MSEAGALPKASSSSFLESDRLITGITMGFLLAVLAFFMLYPVYDICQLSFYKGGVLTLRNYGAYFTNPRMFRSSDQQPVRLPGHHGDHDRHGLLFRLRIDANHDPGKGALLYPLHLASHRSFHHPGVGPDPSFRPKRVDHPIPASYAMEYLRSDGHHRGGDASTVFQTPCSSSIRRSLPSIPGWMKPPRASGLPR